MVCRRTRFDHRFYPHLRTRPSTRELLISIIPGILTSFHWSSSPSIRSYSNQNSGPTPHLGAPHYPCQRMPSPYCPSTNPKRISTSWNRISEQGVFVALRSSTLSSPWDRDVPYSPSFVLDLAANVDEHIKNVVDFVFLPGFNNPTVAVLFQSQQTWTG